MLIHPSHRHRVCLLFFFTRSDTIMKCAKTLFSNNFQKQSFTSPLQHPDAKKIKEIIKSQWCSLEVTQWELSLKNPIKNLLPGPAACETRWCEQTPLNFEGFSDSGSDTGLFFFLLQALPIPSWLFAPISNDSLKRQKLFF